MNNNRFSNSDENWISYLRQCWLAQRGLLSNIDMPPHHHHDEYQNWTPPPLLVFEGEDDIDIEQVDDEDFPENEGNEEVEAVNEPQNDEEQRDVREDVLMDTDAVEYQEIVNPSEEGGEAMMEPATLDHQLSCSNSTDTEEGEEEEEIIDLHEEEEPKRVFAIPKPGHLYSDVSDSQSDVSSFEYDYDSTYEKLTRILEECPTIEDHSNEDCSCGMSYRHLDMEATTAPRPELLEANNVDASNILSVPSYSNPMMPESSNERTYVKLNVTRKLCPGRKKHEELCDEMNVTSDESESSDSEDFVDDFTKLLAEKPILENETEGTSQDSTTDKKIVLDAAAKLDEIIDSVAHRDEGVTLDNISIHHPIKLSNNILRLIEVDKSRDNPSQEKMAERRLKFIPTKANIFGRCSTFDIRGSTLNHGNGIGFQHFNEGTSERDHGNGNMQIMKELRNVMKEDKKENNRKRFFDLKWGSSDDDDEQCSSKSRRKYKKKRREIDESKLWRPIRSEKYIRKADNKPGAIYPYYKGHRAYVPMFQFGTVVKNNNKPDFNSESVQESLTMKDLENVSDRDELMKLLKCNVCSDTIEWPILLSCNHITCSTCVKEDQKNCPICEKKIIFTHKMGSVQNLIDEMELNRKERIEEPSNPFGNIPFGRRKDPDREEIRAYLGYKSNYKISYDRGIKGRGNTNEAPDSDEMESNNGSSSYLHDGRFSSSSNEPKNRSNEEYSNSSLAENENINDSCKFVTSGGFIPVIVKPRKVQFMVGSIPFCLSLPPTFKISYLQKLIINHYHDMPFLAAKQMSCYISLVSWSRYEPLTTLVLNGDETKFSKRKDVVAIEKNTKFLSPEWTLEGIFAYWSHLQGRHLEFMYDIIDETEEFEDEEGNEKH